MKVNADVITTTDIKPASEISAKLFSDDLVSHINKLKRAADEVEKEFKIVISPLLKLKNALSLKEDKQELRVAIEKTHSAVLNTALAEQLNIDQKKLKDKFNQLSSRWCNPKKKLTDTEGYRLVTDFIIKKLNNPLTFSMLADDTANFKKNFQEENGDILCFEFCCLCGSEKIINEVYLKDREKIKCLTLSEHAIAYALSSSNQNLTIQLAKKGVELGKKNPGHTGLYCFGDYKTVKNVKEIFTPTTDVSSKKNASLS